MRHPDRIRALAVFLVALGVAMGGVAANTTVTYTFNGADQLTQVTSSQSGVLARFTYDGDNLRATKTVGSATVIYVRGPSGEVIAEYSGSGVLLAEYVYLDGQRVCKITKDGQGVEHRVYYHSDIVGTPVALTDEAGQLIAKAEYLPFGEEVVHGAAPDPHKFTGKELDDEIGLYDFGARYYDARLGRFITVDPAAGTNDDPQGWNRFAHGRNNPLRFVDPDGRLSFVANEQYPATEKDVRQAYQEQERLRESLTPAEKKFWSDRFGIDLDKLLTADTGPTVSLAKGDPQLEGAAGSFKNAQLKLNASLNLFGDNATLFQGALLHETTHWAMSERSFLRELFHPLTRDPVVEAIRSRLQERYGNSKGMFAFEPWHPPEPHYAEIYQLGTVVTLEVGPQ